jgi:AcrR family transcriptional regulator
VYSVTLTLGAVAGADAAPAVGPSDGAAFGATEERILRATLRLLGRRGVKRLGMQEVSEVAGVSRATLYRYFPSKDHLIDAVAVFDELTFTDGLARSLAAVDGREERIRAFVAFAFDYIRTHPARALFESEPEFVLGYLLAHLPKLQHALVDQLGDAVDAAPAVASGRLTKDQLVDVVVRLFASSFIIPEPDDRALVQSVHGLLLAPGRQDGRSAPLDH